MPRSRRPDDDEEDDAPGLPKAPSAERVLIEHFPVPVAGRILCTSLGRGQLAAHLADSPDAAEVGCWFVDAFAADETREWMELQRKQVQVVCSADLPEGPFDLMTIASSHRGEAELVRELIQQAGQQLREGGVLVAAVDNPDDRWLHDELRKVFAKVRREPQRHGVVYAAFRHGPPKRIRNFRAEFAFRDRGNLVQAVSRPGVFSHRELDLGARALLDATEVQVGEQVLDIGCGSGAVGLALAVRAADVSLHAIDSNARAVECVKEGALLNGLTRVTSMQTATGEIASPGTFDLAIGNPPYYSQYRIAEIFVQAARRALKPGGRVAMVTRKPEWFEARFRQLFADVEVAEVRTYFVVRARQRPPA